MVVQWIRICLPVQGTQVWSLVWKVPTCCGGGKPVYHDSWILNSWSLCSARREVTEMRSWAPQLESSPLLAATRKSLYTATKRTGTAKTKNDIFLESLFTPAGSHCYRLVKITRPPVEPLLPRCSICKLTLRWFRCPLLLGRKAMTNLNSVLKSRDITLPTKVHIVNAMVFSVVMYRCESWTRKKTERWRIDAF